MAKGKSDKGENMIVSALDQDWAACVEKYNDLTPQERGELALYLTGEMEDPRAAPWIRSWAVALAQTAFLETGLRWSKLHGQ